VESDHEGAEQRFAGDLRELRERAGQPSYSTLERLSSHGLRRATMSDVLNGKRVKEPDWRFVAAFVEACHAAARENGLDPGALGSIADWKRHWDGALRGVLDARVPGSGHQSSAGPQSPARDAPSAPPLDPGQGYSGTAQDPRQVKGWPSTMWGLVPSRLPDFTGREEQLADVRSALADKRQSNPVVILGLCGVGKTQLAVEYAHRAASEYGLVWWIPCDDTKQAYTALEGLEAALGVDDVPQGPGEDRYARLFDVLQQGKGAHDWLLIFDNADEVDLVRSLIAPISPVSGHVLITSRNSGWEAAAEVIELDVFTRAESVEFLRRRVRQFDATAAHQLADAVGDLPLVLEHAVEAQLTPADYISRLAADPLALLDAQPADYPATVASQWRDVLAQLEARAPDAFSLLRCLAYFGSDPIPREALERGGYLPGVSVRVLLRDSVRVYRAVRVLRRAGLLRVSAAAHTIGVHQVTRCVVRAMVGSAGKAAAERSRHDVHLLLAAADPLDPDDPANWRSYKELHGHAAQSAAEACPDEQVRKLAVNLARYLTAVGDPRSALRLADDALSHWVTDAGGGVSGACLAMRQAKAAALLACDQREAAFQVQQETLSISRESPGNWDSEIVLLERMTGARHRLAGDFRAARLADEQSVRAHVRTLGEEHPHTFPALSSVIADLALCGDYTEAAREANQVHGACLGFYGSAGHPAVLFHQNVLGRCLWLSGRLDDAASILAAVRAGYDMALREETIGESHPWLLAHELDYAVLRRDSGLAAAGLRELADDLHHVRRKCWRTLGGDHPQTLAATVALGSVLRRARRLPSEAADVLADAARRYRQALPGHPYAHACRGYAAVARWRQGDDGQSGWDPAAEVTQAAASLGASVGESHPLTLAAVSSTANILADAGQDDAAVAPAERALAGFRARLGPGHPHALACEANVATIRARLGHADAGDDGLAARYAAVFGPGHPDLLRLTQGELIDIDFSPLPLLGRAPSPEGTAPGEALPRGQCLRSKAREAGNVSINKD
jgi:hypothetical protein